MAKAYYLLAGLSGGGGGGREDWRTLGYDELGCVTWMCDYPRPGNLAKWQRQAVVTLMLTPTRYPGHCIATRKASPAVCQGLAPVPNVDTWGPTSRHRMGRPYLGCPLSPGDPGRGRSARCNSP